MIALIATIIMALAWLGYETDWMRVRLPVGVTAPVIELEVRKPWDYFKAKIWNPNFKLYPMWLTHPTVMDPICGWDWLENTMHIIPECRIELNHSGVRYNMTIKEPSIMRSVVTALRAKPGKPYPKMSYSKNKNGGMKFSPMIPKVV